MDNHQLLRKVSRLLPSSFTSCQFRNLADVAETSVPITKLNPPENDHRHSSSFSLNNSSKKPLLFPHSKSNSNGGWFTSSDDFETDTLFSLSSNSGDSFRLRTATRFRVRDEMMKSIDETGRCSFSSSASFDTVISKCSRPRTAVVETNGGRSKSSRTRVSAHEIGSDHISTQLYYHSRRNRRRTKKSSSRYGAVIGESYAVEKRSSDPRGDFRTSMVEMIVEKRIFAAEDLERLLGCFLSLNSASYHAIIFDVFSEICRTLFTN